MMTTIRTRLSLPLIVLIALTPFLITGIYVCGPQFFRMERMTAQRIDSSNAWTESSTQIPQLAVSSSAGPSSGTSIERKCDETMSRFFNHESSPTTNSGLLSFFLAFHGVVIGAFAGAMKAKLI